MYDNIGGKIKILAKVLCIIVAILEFVYGIILLEDQTIIGVLLMIVGPIMAWISSWMLYGYGELIEKTTSIDYNVRAISRNVRRDENKSEVQIKAEAERINKLENMRAQGLITEEEYLKLRSRIMN